MTDPQQASAQNRKLVFEKLISGFGKGWEKGDAAAIGEIFSTSGVFQPTPHDRPITGRAPIVEYWKKTPKEQAEVAFRYGEIFSVGPWFAVEYKCTFRRRRTGEWVDVRGSLFCETKDELITEMRMYWHREIGSGSG